MRNLIALFFLSFILLSSPAIAQIKETYFSKLESRDSNKSANSTVIASVKHGNGIIVATTFTEPVILKVDTLGNTVWSTSAKTENLVWGTAKKIIITPENELYALVDFLGYNFEVWKMNPDNGNIIWRKNLGSQTTWDIAPYKPGSFLLAFSRTGSTMNGYGLSRMSGVDGSEITNYQWPVRYVPGLWNSFHVTSDSQRFIYIGFEANLIKLDSGNTSQVLWDTTYATQNRRNIIQHLHVDAQDHLLFFGYNGGQTINLSTAFSGQVNKANGARMWQTYTTKLLESSFQDMKVQGNNLYVTYNHTLTNYYKEKWATSKIEISSGDVIWENAFRHDSLNTSPSAAEPVALDLDTNGNVYLTGFYTKNTTGRTWGIIKLNGNTGKFIYNTDVRLNPVSNDMIGKGLAAAVINNKPYFLGENQTGYTLYQETGVMRFAALNPATGSVLAAKKVEGFEQFPSKTLAIKNLPNYQTAVLKQVGRTLELELLNGQKNRVWQRTFSHNFMLKGTHLETSSSGQLIVAGYSSQDTAYFPYHKKMSDSLHVYVLNNAGAITKTYHAKEQGFRPVDILTDENNNILFFYANSNTIHVSNLNTAGTPVRRYIGVAYTRNTIYDREFTPGKHAVNIPGNKALFFGCPNFQVKSFVIDKTTLNVTTHTTIWGLRRANYVAALPNNLVLLAGYDLSDDVLYCYNSQTHAVVWDKTYPGYNMVKFAFSRDSTFIYAISSGGPLGDIVVRKLFTKTGNQVWEYVYNGPAGNLLDYPLDIEFDRFRDRIYVSGLKNDMVNGVKTKSVVFLRLDTLGVSVGNIVRNTDFGLESQGTVVKVLTDGTVWAAGNLNSATHGKAGFIFELDTALIQAPVIISGLKPEKADELITVYPNPSSGKCWISTSNRNAAISKIELFSLDGRLVKTLELEPKTARENAMLLEFESPKGLYLLKIHQSETVITRRLLVQ